MLPVPTRSMLDALATDADYVFGSYQRLIEFELVQIRRRIRKITDTTVKNNGLLDLGEAMSGWDTLRVADPAQRKSLLPQVVSSINQVAERFPPTPAGPAAQAPIAVNNPHLIAAITAIKDILAQPLAKGSPAVTAVAKRSFGAGAVVQATDKFTSIVTALNRTLSRTNDKGAGFVFDPKLPASMGALARGTGDSSIIFVSRSALDGTTSAADLAAVLAHEGSHTLADGATADIAYCGRNAHFYLPPEYTVLNAANFEHVAREVLAGRPGPTDDQAAAMHALSVPPLTLVLALLSSRVTRAWIRAFDLFDQGQRSAETLHGLPSLPAKAENITLVNSLIENLFSGMSVLLDSVQGNLILTDSATAADVTVDNAPNALTVTFPRKLAKTAGPPQLAEQALKQILELMQGVHSWFPYTSDQVSAFIMGIERLDRQNLRVLLQDYYGRFRQDRDLTA